MADEFVQLHVRRARNSERSDFNLSEEEIHAHAVLTIALDKTIHRQAMGQHNAVT